MAADFWAFDSMRPPPQPIPCQPQTLQNGFQFNSCLCIQNQGYRPI